MSKRMSRLHGSGTQYISRDRSITRDGEPLSWKGHAAKELARRRKLRKVAKQARKVNRKGVKT